jgi:SAM-dependent methyltransferase
VDANNAAQTTAQQDQPDSTWRSDRRWVQSLDAQLDPGTIKLLETVGVASGWRCLEVGAGSGSIAAWLCRRVGPSGRVVATEADTQALSSLNLPNLEVRPHDLANEALPEGEFDLVHSRWVLAFLRDRPAALRRLLAAVKPGGWLIVEEPDYANPRSARHLLEGDPAMELYYGRKLYPDSRPLALRDMGLEARVTILRQPDQYILAGPITETNVADQINLLDYSVILFQGPVTFTVWGRRREGAAGSGAGRPGGAARTP